MRIDKECTAAPKNACFSALKHSCTFVLLPLLLTHSVQSFFKSSSLSLIFLSYSLVYKTLSFGTPLSVLYTSFFPNLFYTSIPCVFRSLT